MDEFRNRPLLYRKIISDDKISNDEKSIYENFEENN